MVVWVNLSRKKQFFSCTLPRNHLVEFGISFLLPWVTKSSEVAVAWTIGFAAFNGVDSIRGGHTASGRIPGTCHSWVIPRPGHHGVISYMGPLRVNCHTRPHCVTIFVAGHLRVGDLRPFE